MQRHEHGEKKRCGKRNQRKRLVQTYHEHELCRESGGGGGSCNPGEIQLLPVRPLRRHFSPSPEANAAASPTAAAAATGLESDRRPGEGSGRSRRRLNRRLVRTHTRIIRDRERVLGGRGGNTKKGKELFLASSWLDLAGARRGGGVAVCPAARLVCAWQGWGPTATAGGRAMISSPVSVRACLAGPTCPATGKMEEMKRAIDEAMMGGGWRDPRMISSFWPAL